MAIGKVEKLKYIEKSDRSRSRFFALIPIIVKIHEARALATVSVGEKPSPFPLLSIGASVINESLEAR